MRLLRIPLTIVPDCDTKFVSKFWHDFRTTVGIELCLNTAFHPQSDDQLERIIQTLEDMSRTCALDYAGSWCHSLPLVEFPYNNNYHVSIGMALYEALYG